jgi:hypothetical protein
LVFRDLGLRHDDSSIQLVKDTRSTLTADRPIESYLKIAYDLKGVAGEQDLVTGGASVNAERS